MAGQADNADIVGEILAAELGADAELLGGLQQFILQFDIAEGLAVLVPFAWAGRRVPWRWRA